MSEYVEVQGIQESENVIRLTLTDVPMYLRGGKLYESFVETENDPTQALPIEFDVRHVKTDTTVQSVSDLSRLLSTLRFWQCDNLPDEAIILCLDGERSVGTTLVLEEYLSTLPQLNALVAVQQLPSSGEQLLEAVRQGSVQIMRCLHHLNPNPHRGLEGSDSEGEETDSCVHYRNPHHHDGQDCSNADREKTNSCDALSIATLREFWCTEVCETAAEYGQLECLRYAREVGGCPWDRWTADTALQYRNQSCLLYAIEHHCPLPKYFDDEGYDVDGEEEYGCPYYYPQSEINFAERYGAGDDEDFDFSVEMQNRKHKVPFVRAVAATGFLDCLVSLHELREVPLFSSESESVQLCRATCSNVECLSYVLQHGATLPPDIMESAAFQGVPAVLQHLRGLGCAWGPTAQILLHCRHLVCLQQVLEWGCPLPDDAAMQAARGGDIDCLCHVVEIGAVVREDAVEAAAFSGSVPCLQFIIEQLTHVSMDSNGSSITYGGNWRKPTVCSVAAGRGHMNLLRYAHENGCPWDSSTTTAAAYSGHSECFLYAYEHGCAVDLSKCFMELVLEDMIDAARRVHKDHGAAFFPANACAVAARAEAWKCAIFAFEQGCSFKADCFSIAASLGGLEMMQYAHEHGCIWDDQTTLAAAEHGHVRCLQFAHENGCPMHVQTCVAAARGGSVACLQYAHEHRCPWSNYITSIAALFGKRDCLKYAVEHGCPADASAMEKYHSWFGARSREVES